MSGFLNNNNVLPNNTNFTYSILSGDVNRNNNNKPNDVIDEDLGFLVANTRLLVAITLGVVLVILILTTLKFVTRLFSKHFALSAEEIE